MSTLIDMRSRECIPTPKSDAYERKLVEEGTNYSRLPSWLVDCYLKWGMTILSVFPQEETCFIAE